MAGEETRERILDTAERLFSEKGLAGTSLRAITREAGVNLASVHYHFGSKDELLRAALARIVEPTNRERLEMLERAEADAGDEPPTVEAILEAFVAPDLRVIRELGERGRVITRFLGRSYTEPSETVQGLIGEFFGELGRRFREALARAVPDVPPEELGWRLRCVVAVITYTMAAYDTPDEGLPGLLDPDDLEGTSRRLIAFAAAGIGAPHSAPARAT